MLSSSRGKAFNFTFTFHLMKEIHLEFSTFLNSLLYILDPVRPPSASPWLLFAIQRCAPAGTWQLLKFWDGVVNAKVFWVFRQKHHSGTAVPSTTCFYQRIPSWFKTSQARSSHKARLVYLIWSTAPSCSKATFYTECCLRTRWCGPLKSRAVSFWTSSKSATINNPRNDS